MKKHFSLLCILLAILSCRRSYNEPIDGFAQPEELIFIDSILMKESSGLLSRPSKATLINDSLVAVESVYTRGIWVFDIRTGLETNSILNKSVMEISFYTAGSEWKFYPSLYILDGITKTVYHFDLSQNSVSEDKFIGQVSLEVPEGFRIMPETDTFHFTGKEYIVEMASLTFKSSANFYKNSEEFLGVFDSSGKFLFRFLKYPKSLTDLNGFLEPSSVYNSGYIDTENLLLISFPSEGEILMIDSLGNSADLKKIQLPRSRYFSFELPLLETESGNNMALVQNRPTAHHFKEIEMDQDNLYFQSFMKDNENLDRFLLTSHIMKYNVANEIWSESINPQNFFNSGVFAGVLNDTLYFVEAGMINREEKYIKRAVLRPIED
ncbi:hypothetical protein [Algoriphagus namhaensis]